MIEAAGEAPNHIEGDIRRRNHAFENLRRKAQSQSPGSRLKPEVKPPQRRETLHAVPINQLNLEVINPERIDTSVDIVAVHGLGAIPHKIGKSDRQA